MKNDKVRTDRLEIRLERGEKEAFQRAARIAGIPLSSWIRERLRGISKTELAAADEPIAFLNGRSRRS
jgi:hypothetical protein